MPADGPDRKDHRVERLKKENQRLKEKLNTLKKERAADKRDFNNIRKAFHDMPGGLALVQDGKIRFINQEALDRIGYSEKEVLNSNFLNYIHPDAANQVNTYNKNRISGKSAPERYETCILTKNGEKRSCEVRAKKIRYKNRKAVALNFIDMDQRKIEEKRALELLKTELASHMAEGMCARLDDYLSGLDRVFEDIGRFESLSGSDMENLRASIEKWRTRGNVLSDCMRTLSEDENEAPGDSCFDIKTTVSRAIDTARSPQEGSGLETSSRSIDIKTYLKSCALVQGDPRALQEALSAILLNAFEALPEGGEIHITTEEHGGFALIYIQDDGPGIPDVIKEKIFDPFFTTKETAGSGLGLALARAIIRRHRGEIELMSRKGQGSTFIIKLPVSDDAPAAEKQNGIKNLRDSSILIIMKDELASDLLFRFMESRGVRVRSVLDNKEAVKLLTRGHFDLVVSDGLVRDPASLRIAAESKNNKAPLSIAVIEDHSGPFGASYDSNYSDADLIIKRPLKMDEILPLLGNLIQRNRT